MREKVRMARQPVGTPTLTERLHPPPRFAMNRKHYFWPVNCGRVFLPVEGMACLGSVAAIYRAWRRDIGNARARVSTGSSIIHTARGPIEYASIGEGAPLLVIHGAGGGFDQALNFAGDLNKAGFRCIFVSRFGYLRTPLPNDGSPEAQADQYACLLDSLGVLKAAVLGVSAGGPSALQFAIRHPRRCSALALLAPATFAPDGAGIHDRR